MIFAWFSRRFPIGLSVSEVQDPVGHGQAGFEAGAADFGGEPGGLSNLAWAYAKVLIHDEALMRPAQVVQGASAQPSQLRAASSCHPQASIDLDLSRGA